MTKFDIYSDIHIDSWMNFYKDKEDFTWMDRIEVNSDYAIFAGDAGNQEKYYDYVIKGLKTRYKEVIGVRGNHEFYITNYNVPHQKGRDMLSCVEMEIEGLRIVGCTLWANMWSNTLLYGQDIRRMINDFKFIPEFWDRQHNAPDYAARLYWTSRDWLLGRAGADIVVTHFAPTLNSIHSKYAGNALNPWFANDDEELLRLMKPKVWVHGHTHSHFDFEQHDVRVVCNPIGYPRENMNNLAITPLTIEVDNVENGTV